jgi:hypothetical protein
MASLQLARVVVDWAGSMVKGASASILYFEAGSGARDMAPIRTAFLGLAGILPTGLTITYPTAGDLVDEFTGTLLGAYSSASVAATNGSGAAASAAGVGACVTWQTGQVVAGRRLRGRTFLVPLSSGAYDVDGTLTTTAKNTIQTFADAMNAIPEFCVWHRPSGKGASDGASRLVSGVTVKDKVAILTSRRD